MSSLHSPTIMTTPVGELQAETERLSQEQLQFLVHLVDQSDIEELEVRRDDSRTRLVLRKVRQSSSDAPFAESDSPTEEAGCQETEPGRVSIQAPCVGFFQSSSQANKKPLVAVGDSVKSGQQVAVVRSLGVANEVEAAVAGRIVEILVKDGQSVEYGQALMVIEQ